MIKLSIRYPEQPMLPHTREHWCECGLKLVWGLSEISKIHMMVCPAGLNCKGKPK